MAHIEVKAVCDDLKEAEAKLRSLQTPEEIRLTYKSKIKDTYFLSALPGSNTMIKIRLETPIDSPILSGKDYLLHSKQRSSRTGESVPLGELPLLSRGELIAYTKQPMSDGSFLSDGHNTDLSVLEFQSPEHAKNTIALIKQSNPIQQVVQKKRTLMWIGKTRVHLDDVSGLGHFIEFEYKLENPKDKNEIEKGQREIAHLKDFMGIKETIALPFYSTMLMQKQAKSLPLLSNPIFSGLSASARSKLIQQPKDIFPDDAFMIEKGPVKEPYAYGILKGNVRVFSDKDCQHKIADRKEGELLGELALAVDPKMPNAERNAYVRTNGQVEVVKMHQDFWQEMYKSSGPQFANELVKRYHRAQLEH